MDKTLNPYWTKNMLTTPSPKNTLGLYLNKGFVERGYGLGTKQYIKRVDDKGRIRYCLNAIWHLDRVEKG